MASVSHKLTDELFLSFPRLVRSSFLHSELYGICTRRHISHRNCAITKLDYLGNVCFCATDKTSFRVKKKLTTGVNIMIITLFISLNSLVTE